MAYSDWPAGSGWTQNVRIPAVYCCTSIEGEISFEEANALLQSYYGENRSHLAGDRTEEADRVSARIAALLSEKAFSLTPNEFLSIHRKLFTGIYPHAGCVRNVNITKKEWVLDGNTVLYGNADVLMETLDDMILEEREFSYRGLSMHAIIRHFADFLSGLWQIHVFSEGNIRTQAVFFIRYLRTLGFHRLSDAFAENACIFGTRWYGQTTMTSKTGFLRRRSFWNCSCATCF